MKVSKEILNLIPYSPGKPIEETKREYGLDEVIKLASNENPLGPSQKVVEALRKALPDLHRYPDASCYELKQKLSRFYEVPTDWLTFGNGSNELIDLLIRIYCESGESILTSDAAFVAYGICAQAARVRTFRTPLTSDFRFDLSAMARSFHDHATQEKIRLIFIANPNNPTGTYVTDAEVKKFMASVGNRDDVLIVFDEAYFEFVRANDYPRALDLVKEFSNVVVLRTMSKVFGIAGLRIGALVARPDVVDLVNRVRNPFNVNTLAQVATAAAIDDSEYLQRVQQTNWQGLDYYYSALKNLGVDHWPSEANFILIDTHRAANDIFEAMLKRGVIVRPVKIKDPATHIRLSVGLQRENEAAISALKDVLKELPSIK